MSVSADSARIVHTSAYTHRLRIAYRRLHTESECTLSEPRHLADDEATATLASITHAHNARAQYIYIYAADNNNERRQQYFLCYSFGQCVLFCLL